MSSKSKSSQSSSTNQEDNRVGAEGEAIAIGHNSEISIDVIDSNAWEFSNAALNFADRIAGTLEDLAVGSADRADEALSRALGIAEQQSEDPADKTAALIGTLIVAGAAIAIFKPKGIF